MNKRKAISKKTRFEIFKRDGFSCQYCGATPPKSILEVDHIIPVRDGGSNDQDNLTTSCYDCNRGKAANSLDSIPISMSEKAKIVKEQEDQLKGYSMVMAERRERKERDAWEVANIFCDAHFLDPFTDGINKKYLQSIKRFNDELGVFDVIEAMEIAVSKFCCSQQRSFKYFCGICWRKISEL